MKERVVACKYMRANVFFADLWLTPPPELSFDLYHALSFLL